MAEGGGADQGCKGGERKATEVVAASTAIGQARTGTGWCVHV